MWVDVWVIVTVNVWLGVWVNTTLRVGEDKTNTNIFTHTPTHTNLTKLPFSGKIFNVLTY